MTGALVPSADVARLEGLPVNEIDAALGAAWQSFGRRTVVDAWYIGRALRRVKDGRGRHFRAYCESIGMGRSWAYDLLRLADGPLSKVSGHRTVDGAVKALKAAATPAPEPTPAATPEAAPVEPEVVEPEAVDADPEGRTGTRARSGEPGIREARAGEGSGAARYPRRAACRAGVSDVRRSAGEVLLGSTEGCSMTSRTDDRWMMFIYRSDEGERADTLGADDARHEADRLLERAGFNSRAEQHRTRESAEQAARDMLRRLAAIDAGVPWVACVANPYSGPGSGSGACYRVE